MKKRRITVNIDTTLKYIQLWNGIFNLTDKEAEILAHFMEVNDFKKEDNICSVSNKKDVAALVGIKDYNTLNNYIKRFKDKKVMFKQETGNYIVNPFLDPTTTSVEVLIKNDRT
tara:strand:- start:1265 stop:1606 length:342 start_codon:yes stop_codon:yes gene_type:complete